MGDQIVVAPCPTCGTTVQHVALPDGTTGHRRLDAPLCLRQCAFSAAGDLIGAGLRCVGSCAKLKLHNDPCFCADHDPHRPRLRAVPTKGDPL